MAKTRSESIKRYYFASNQFVHSLADVFWQIERICTVDPVRRDWKMEQKYKRFTRAQRAEARRQLMDDLRASVALLDSGSPAQ